MVNRADDYAAYRYLEKYPDASDPEYDKKMREHARREEAGLQKFRQDLEKENSVDSFSDGVKDAIWNMAWSDGGKWSLATVESYYMRYSSFAKLIKNN